MTRPVAVLGAGAFGCGIAVAAARRGRNVLLWSRKERDLGDTKIRWTRSLSALAEAEVLFLAVPSPYIPEVAAELGKSLDGRHYLVHVSRGLIGEQLAPISRVLREQTPAHRIGALAGPLVPDALHAGTTSGAILGTRFPEVTAAVRAAIASPTLRIYETPDIVGVEVASAMVGLMALAAGYARGSGIEGAALAVFLTRALAEADRLAPSLGAERETLHGLAGVGDLLAVVAGDVRPEEQLGRALAGGMSLNDAGKDLQTHIEGVSIAHRLVAHAERLRLDAPISQAIVAVLNGESASVIVSTLMARSVGSE